MNRRNAVYTFGCCFDALFTHVAGTFYPEHGMLACRFRLCCGCTVRGMPFVTAHRMPYMAAHRLCFAVIVHHRLFPFQLGTGIYRENTVRYDFFSFG